MWGWVYSSSSSSNSSSSSSRRRRRRRMQMVYGPQLVRSNSYRCTNHAMGPLSSPAPLPVLNSMVPSATWAMLCRAGSGTRTSGKNSMTSSTPSAMATRLRCREEAICEGFGVPDSNEPHTSIPKLQLRVGAHDVKGITYNKMHIDMQ